MADTIPGDTTTTVILDPSAPIDVVIDDLGDDFDDDYLRVELVAGRTYTFTTSPPEAGSPSVDTYIYLTRTTYSANVAENDDYTTTSGYSQITYTPTESGTYFLAVGGFDTDPTSEGPVRVTMTETAPPPLSADTIAADTDTDAVLVPGTAFSSALETATDHDWLRLDVTAGHAYRIAPTGVASLVTLRDSDGAALASDGRDGNAGITYIATVTGTIFVDISSTNETVGNYSVTATDLGTTADVVPDNNGTTLTLDTGAPVDVVINPPIGGTGDADWIRVELVAGTRYVITTSNVSGETAPVDTLITLRRDDSSAVLAENDDYGDVGSFSQVSYVPSVSGTYYLSVAGFDTSPSSQGNVRVSMTSEVLPPDIPGNDTTTEVLTPGTPITAELETSGDRDWFRLDVTAGQNYTIRTGVAAGSTATDTTLRLLAADGTAIVANADGGPGSLSEITYTATTTGTLFVEASGAGTTTGKYTLAVAETAPTLDVVPAGITSTEVLVPGTVTGVIDANGDIDTYQVTVRAGQTYTFVTGDPGTPGDRDTVLTLRDAAGGSLVTNDDGAGDGFSRVRYVATEDQTLYLDVGGKQDLAFGDFTLRMAERSTADTVGQTLATASTALTVGGTVDSALETGADRDLYRIELVAGETYLISTKATGLGGDADTLLVLFGSTGQVNGVDYDENGTIYSTIRLTAQTTGSYYVRVQSQDGAAGEYSIGVTTTTPLPINTNDQIADQLVDGYWEFAGTTGRHFDTAPGGILTFDVTGLTTGRQVFAREALALWTDVTGIVFREVTDASASLVFDDTVSGRAYASSTVSNGIVLQSQINIANNFSTDDSLGFASYVQTTFIHEIGHALGLGHAGNYNGSADYSDDAIGANDAWNTSIMSYFSQQENTYFAQMGYNYNFPATPMAADAVATERLYGDYAGPRTGDTRYGFGNDSGRAVYGASDSTLPIGYTIYDGGGIDTLDYSGYTEAAEITLVPEAFSNVGGSVGNLVIARGVTIENVIGGAGMDKLTGNMVANVLSGMAGDDALIGAEGDDILIGGLGADMLLGGDGSDTASYAGATDSVIVDLGFPAANTGEAAGDIFDSIENLIGTAGSDRLRGAADVANILDGASGADILRAVGSGDTLIGGGNNDKLYVSDTGVIVDGGTGAADVLIVEAGSSESPQIAFGAGQITGIESIVVRAAANVSFAAFDTAIATISVGTAGSQSTLLYGTQGADRISVTGAGRAELRGNDGNDVITLRESSGYADGGAGDDVIRGGAGATTIVGGAGADRMTGGAGADLFQFAALTEVTGDKILDFNASEGDRIDLSTTDTPGGFAFIGTDAFSVGSTATEIRTVIKSNGDTRVEFDVNHDGKADLSLFVRADAPLDANAFVGIGSDLAAHQPHEIAALIG